MQFFNHTLLLTLGECTLGPTPSEKHGDGPLCARFMSLRRVNQEGVDFLRSIITMYQARRSVFLKV